MPVPVPPALSYVNASFDDFDVQIEVKSLKIGHRHSTRERIECLDKSCHDVLALSLINLSHQEISQFFLNGMHSRDYLLSTMPNGLRTYVLCESERAAQCAVF